jgi:hypothetical protein
MGVAAKVVEGDERKKPRGVHPNGRKIGACRGRWKNKSRSLDFARDDSISSSDSVCRPCRGFLHQLTFPHRFHGGLHCAVPTGLSWRPTELTYTRQRDRSAGSNLFGAWLAAWRGTAREPRENSCGLRGLDVDFFRRRKLDFVTREKRILWVAFSRRMVTFAARLARRA